VSRTLSVLKLGGSVLRDDASYAAAARFLHDRLAGTRDERLVVIVSAQHGSTDTLLAEAQAIVTGAQRGGETAGALPSEVSEEALDLLWSTGELRWASRASSSSPASSASVPAARSPHSGGADRT